MLYKSEPLVYQINIRAARKFLRDGDSVSVVTILRGRELQYKDLANNLALKFAQELADIAKIEFEPRLEGKALRMKLTAKLD